MSLTENADVFVGVHEDALNDLIAAVATDRPRLLVYGSPAFVPVTTVADCLHHRCAAADHPTGATTPRSR
jgi:hypothetical protein